MRSCWLRTIAALGVLYVGASAVGAQVVYDGRSARRSGPGLGVTAGPAGVNPADVPTTTVHVNGVVVSTTDGKPVARALVSSIDQRFAALTDWEGRFSLEYRMPTGAQAGMFGTTGFVALTVRRPGFEFTTGPVLVPRPDAGSSTVNLQVKIKPTATISGHVSPDEGELPNGLRVMLRRQQAQEGVSQWVQAGNAQVDRNGDFRFPNLTAGDYVVSTMASSRVAGLGGAKRPDTIRGLLPTYYPGGTTPAEATPIHLHAGEAVTANLRPLSATFYRVSVGVEGVPGPDFGAALQSDAGYTLRVNRPTHTVEGYLPSGSYMVRVDAFSPPGQREENRPVNPGRRNRATSFAHLAVSSAPVVGRTITAAPGGEIQVIVTRDFSQVQPVTVPVRGGPGERTPPPVYVDLQSADLQSFGGAEQDTDADTVTLRGVAEGTYHVHINPTQGYVASAISGSTNLLTTPLRVSSDGRAGPIYVTLRDDFASLSPRVRGAPASTQVEPMLAMAIPLDTPEVRVMPLAVYTTMPQAPSIQVPPGRYLVIGMMPAQFRTVQYRDPDVLRDLMSKGVTVTLGPGEKKEVEVSPLPEEDQ